MKLVNEVTIELEDMGSILAVISRAMPYSVPLGYFDWKMDQIREECGLESASGTLPKKVVPYTVPQGYFDGLAANIMTTIAVEGAAFTSTKDLPFHVPAGYFTALPAQALQAAKSSGYVSGIVGNAGKKQAKVIPFRPAFSQIRWAVASSLFICVTLGGYISFFSSGGQSGTAESVLANVSKEEIQDYLQHSYVIDVNRIVNTGDINQLEVDNKDIEQYLNETGWDVVD